MDLEDSNKSEPKSEEVNVEQEKTIKELKKIIEAKKDVNKEKESIMQKEAELKSREETLKLRIAEFKQETVNSEKPSTSSYGNFKIKEEADQETEDPEIIIKKFVSNFSYWTARQSTPELMKFSGSIEDWQIFHSFYKSSTRRCGFDNVDNLHRLQTSLSGEARSIVENLLHEPKNKIRSRCPGCKILRAKANPPQMSNLPQCRLSPYTHPFTFTGIDCMGPINVVMNRKTQKRWVCLFTCLTVRAIHLEILYGMDHDNFIMAFENFMAIMGRPRDVYCDNGCNFVKAERLLKTEFADINMDLVKEKFENVNTKFHFNPPESPHMGGSWERLVKSIKNTFYSMKPPRTMTDPLLRNFMMLVQGIINSRPLTYVPLSNEEEPALTPNHFLRGTSGDLKPFGVFNDDAKILKSNWLMAQKYADIFWRKWIMEYLPSLNRRKIKDMGDLPFICPPCQNNMKKQTMGTLYGTAISHSTPVKKIKNPEILTKEKLLEMTALKLKELESLQVQLNQMDLEDSNKSEPKSEEVNVEQEKTIKELKKIIEAKKDVNKEKESIMQKEAELKSREETLKLRIAEFKQETVNSEKPSTSSYGNFKIKEEADQETEDPEIIIKKFVSNFSYWTARQSTPELMKFSGSIEDWQIFHSFYKSSTRRCGFDNVDNLHRLQTSLSGEARSIVENLLHEPKNVPTILEILKNRYEQFT
uniref:CSON000201 protein n=1 Tax=Culicoides sonorensis TaxID=179676 RepID=A0A336L4Q0_CULSO